MDMNDMLEQLDRAGEWELNTILQRILKRYEQLFSEEELLFISLPKNDMEERKRILDALYDQDVT